MTIDCTVARERIRQEGLAPDEEAALGAHLVTCASCLAEADGFAPVADSIVAAAASADRYRRTAGRATKVVLAASLLAAIGFALRPNSPSERIYVIRGDSTGVVLTGPGVERRTETTPPLPTVRKGDRT